VLGSRVKIAVRVRKLRISGLVIQLGLQVQTRFGQGHEQGLWFLMPRQDSDRELCMLRIQTPGHQRHFPVKRLERCRKA